MRKHWRTAQLDLRQTSLGDGLRDLSQRGFVVEAHRAIDARTVLVLLRVPRG